MVIAELVYVLESVYRLPRSEIVDIVTSVIEHPAIRVEESMVIHHAVRDYERHNVDFADAYVAACASFDGVRAVASFDRHFNRLTRVRRVDPGAG